jgi:hypothetical protein
LASSLLSRAEVSGPEVWRQSLHGVQGKITMYRLTIYFPEGVTRIFKVMRDKVEMRPGAIIFEDYETGDKIVSSLPYFIELKF